MSHEGICLHCLYWHIPMFWTPRIRNISRVESWYLFWALQRLRIHARYEGMRWLMHKHYFPPLWRRIFGAESVGESERWRLIRTGRTWSSSSLAPVTRWDAHREKWKEKAWICMPTHQKCSWLPSIPQSSCEAVQRSGHEECWSQFMMDVKKHVVFCHGTRCNKCCWQDTPSV